MLSECSHEDQAGGHESRRQGQGPVAIDEVSRDVVSFPAGRHRCQHLVDSGLPVDNNGLSDTAKEITATTRAGGTVFRVIEFARAWRRASHRTDSIDYAIVLAVRST